MMRDSLKFILALSVATSSLAVADDFSDFYRRLSPSLVSGMAKDEAYWRTIFGAETVEMADARRMVAEKGDAWNDRETRIQLFKGRWRSLLAYAMRTLPEEEKAAAGSLLAEDIFAFLTEIKAFDENDESVRRLWGYAESFDFLFDPNGEVKLQAPAGFEKEMAHAKKHVEEYIFFGELSRLLKQAEDEEKGDED